VLDGEREVDSFGASDIQTLRFALRPILAHAVETGVRVEFTGEIDEHLPFGLRRQHRELRLTDVNVAQLFLSGLFG
jgi:hypothetical protein